MAAPPSWKGWAIIAAAALATWWLEPRAPQLKITDNPRRRRRRNAGGDPALEKAAREWESFHWGRKAKTAKRMRVPERPETLVKLGDLESVVYKTRKGDEPVTHYHHTFADPKEGAGGNRKPVLAMDPKTRRLHVVGGSYSVGWRGIVG